MLVGGSVSDCCCLLRRETKHSVWGVLPAPPVPWASNFGYKSRLLAAVFIRRQFCVKCDAGELVLPQVGQAGLGVVNLKGCTRSRVHIQGGVAVGQLSLPSAVLGLGTTEWQLLCSLGIVCSKARGSEGSAAFCLLYAVLTIFACSLVVAAYKCEVQKSPLLLQQGTTAVVCPRFRY